MNRNLTVMAVSYFLWGIGEGMFLYFQPVYLQQLGADPVKIGVILGAMGVAITIAQAPAGYLADRFGRRPFIWASWLAAAAAIWIMALAPSLEIFTLGLLIYGFTAFGASAQNSYIARASRGPNLGRTLTLMWALYFLANVIGSIAGGALGQAFGLKSVYLAAAVTLLFPALLILFIGPQAVESRPQGQGRLEIFKNRSFLIFLGVILIAMTAAYLPYPLAPNYLQNQKQVSLGELGWLAAIGSLGSAVILLALGRMKPGLAFVAGQFIMLLFAALLLFGDSLVWFGAAYFFLGGFRLVRSISAALGRSIVKGSEMGLAFGLIETFNGGAFILAPILAGQLYSIDPTLVFKVALAGILVSMGIFGFYLLLVHARAVQATAEPDSGL
jgi:MFS family permease